MWIFSTWVGLGALWSFYPAYATTKGLAFAALSLGALAILWCGAEWGRAGRCLALGNCPMPGREMGGRPLGSRSTPDAPALWRRVDSRASGTARVGTLPSSEHVRRLLVVSGGILFARWRTVRDVWGGAPWLRLGFWRRPCS